MSKKLWKICRYIAGPLVSVLLLILFLHSEILQESITHYHTGEGSIMLDLAENDETVIQQFRPVHSHLESISFLLEFPDGWDGEVEFSITDASGKEFYHQILYSQNLNPGAYTDVKTDLWLKAGRRYYERIRVSASSQGQYPSIAICGRENRLPEKGKLVENAAEDSAISGWNKGDQLVTRYEYGNALRAGVLLQLILLCLATAVLIMAGLPDRWWLRKAAGILLLFAMPVLLGYRLEMLTYNASMYLPMALKWNLFMMALLEVFLLLVTHSPGLTVSISGFVLTLLYSANHYICLFRGTPLRMNDLTAIKTAATVAGGYDYTPTGALALCWLWCFFFVVAGLCTIGGKKEAVDGRRPLKIPVISKPVLYGMTFAMAVLLGGVSWYVFVCTDFFQQRGFADEEFNGFYHDVIYSFDGYLVASFIEIQNSRPVPPKGYDAGQVETLLSGMQKESGEKIVQQDYPHIIIVMNESLADLNVLTELNMIGENMEFMKSLQENTVKGYTNAAVLGGGTANSEFEMLTGCTTAFYATNYYPYQQAVTRPLHSMVSQLEKYGYTTVSMHPELADNWNRQKVYRYLGFENSLWKQDFAGAQVIHRGVSDLETYHKIIDIYENRQEGKPLFVFDITMQNHGAYMGDDGPYEIRDLTCNNSSVDQYLSLVKISDEALEELVHYFEKEEEKVIICIFGDHQPAVTNTIVDKYHLDTRENPEEHMKMFKTPFYIWANYDIEEGDGYDISMNYLGGLILDTAGVPLSPYFSYLKQLRQEYPIITINGYVDKNGGYHDWNEPDPFDSYRAVQYNYLFDKNTFSWAY